MTAERQQTSTSENGRGFYTRGEEIANSITHGLGTVLSAAGLVALVVLASRHGDVWQVVSFSIYGGTLVLLYLASTLYHALPGPGAKGVFRIIDHASIHLLIAGTYTPFLLVSLRGTLGWALLGTIWGLALLGILFEAFLIGRYRRASLLSYMVMGWLGVVGLKQLLATFPVEGVIWLAAGGLLYTGGILFYVWRRLRYSHAIWHLFVLAGSLCHYVAILRYLLPEIW